MMLPGETPGDFSKRMQQAKLYSTSMQNSYREIADAASESFRDSTDAAGKSFAYLARIIENSISDSAILGSEKLLDALVSAAKRAPAKMQPYLKQIAAVSAQAISKRGGDPSLKMAQLIATQSVSVQSVSNQTARVTATRRAADKAKIPDEKLDEFMGNAFSRNKMDKFRSIQSLREQIDNSTMGKGAKDIANAALDKEEAKTVKEVESSATANLVAAARMESSSKALTSALTKKSSGAGSSILRSLYESKGGIGTHLRARADAEAAAAEGGESVGVMGEAVNQGIAGLSGLVDSLMPMGAVLGIAAGAIAVLVAGFDQMRATGSSAFMALSAKGQETGADFQESYMALNRNVYAATALQRVSSLISGVNLDKMILASSGAIAKTGLTVPGKSQADRDANMGGLVASFNSIQMHGTMAGLSIEESFGIATKAARAFNLHSGPKTLGFFDKLIGLADDAKMSMKDFSEGLGDMMTLSLKYGSSAGQGFAAMSSMFAKTMGGGPALGGLGQSIARDVANTPTMTRIGLHMTATNETWEQVAGDLEGHKLSMADTLNDFFTTMHKEGLTQKDTAGHRLQMIIAAEKTGVLSQQTGDELIANPQFLKMYEAAGVDKRAVTAKIAKMIHDDPKRDKNAMDYMGSQEGLLKQLVEIARSFVMWITGSGFATVFGGSESARMHLIDSASGGKRAGGIHAPENKRG